jgi:hypothetical protein
MALSLGRAAGALACFVCVGAIGWGGYAAQSTLGWLLQVDSALAMSSLRHESNAEAKGDRLAVSAASYQLASLQPTVTAASLSPVPFAPLVRGPAEPADATASVQRPVATPRQEPVRQAEKPKPQPPKPASMLDDTSIANLKHRLRLTADQEGYWPAVEAALRDVVKTHLTRRKDAPSQIDVNSPEVQRLTWAAMPLLMRMREDQKREVRTLARVIGLEAVASQI